MKQSTVNSNIKRIAVICERDRAYGRGVCLGIAEAATYEKNWSLEFLDYPEQVNVTRLKGFDGVIARISNEQIAAELTKAKLPVVDIYTDIIRPEFGSIDGDQPAIGRLAAEYFLKRRYKSFAYCGYEGIGYSDVRQKSFSNTLKENGYDCNVFCVPQRAVDEYAATIMRKEFVRLGSDTAALSRWLKALPYHTALFCCHDVRAWQVLALCRLEKIPVPQRLAVMGVDNDELVCSFTAPTLSSIDNSPFRIGKASVALLSRMFNSSDERKKPKHLIIKPRGVYERASTATFAVEIDWVSEMLDYISSHVADGIRVDDVIAFAKRSKATVEHALKSVTGQTVQHHILWTRLEMAKKLLVFSHKPVAEVARLSGFASPQYFCRFFKSKTGLTAEEFRNQES